MEQLVLDIGIVPEASFARFLPAGNEAALQALQQGVARQIAQASQPPSAQAANAPVYLWGGPGTGKTHLLQAVALAFEQQGLQVGWLRGRQPNCDDAASTSTPDTADDNWQSTWQAILLDDVQHFTPAQQRLAFKHFIDAAHPPDGRPRWVIAAGDAPPVDLALREDLRTRLGSGVSFALQALSDAQRLQVLQMQARERGLHLSAEVGHYLLTRYSRDLSSLTALLARLDTHALRAQRALTLPLLRQALQGESSHDHHDAQA
ncbi:hypothetical protein AAV94_07425 [Lampropedia cohaerens]|uniref:AAA+ ATPase domain-containing protein n=1 Tax=Lampropedia cohaerens TaxID=1610491 RepID=A0A0U1PZQ0_9BURK|nr:DnaA regulatory inactivator Hda [Lampropedia cohaerens]KKW67993.1 hypothetical protein AAV94_07425 [Lampropedia cohaerens]